MLLCLRDFHVLVVLLSTFEVLLLVYQCSLPFYGSFFFLSLPEELELLLSLLSQLFVWGQTKLVLLGGSGALELRYCDRFLLDRVEALLLAQVWCDLLALMGELDLVG